MLKYLEKLCLQRFDNLGLTDSQEVIKNFDKGGKIL